MLITILLRTLTLTVVAQGVSIPQGISDERLTSKRDDALISPNTTANIFQPRDADYDSGTYYCGCNSPVNKVETWDAAVGVVAQLSKNNGVGEIPPSLSWYTTVGDVVAFVCNLETYPVELAAQIYETIVSNIRTNCGDNIAGTYHNQDWGINAGYMQNRPDFCKVADASSSNSC